MKCSKCKDEIPKGKEKYHHKKVLCKWCWDKIHPGHLTKRSFVAWVQRNKEEIKKKMTK